MAIPRTFNSNTPFIIASGGSELSFPGGEDDGRGCEENKDTLVQAFGPHLSRVMQHGTAKHVVSEGHHVDNPCVSIVAQAEREDLQEFSPTNTQCPFSRCQLLRTHRSLSMETSLLSDTEDEDFDVVTKPPLHHLQRKQRRKPRGRSQEDGEQPPIIRGLWVQEIDWLKSAGREMTSSSAEIIPPPPQFSDCRCGDAVRGLEDESLSDARGVSDSDQDCDSESDSSCAANTTQSPDGFKAIKSSLTFDLMQVSGFISVCPAEWDSDSTGCVQSLLGVSDSGDSPSPSQNAFGLVGRSDMDTVVDGLRGRVMKLPKIFISPFFRGMIRRTLTDRKSSEPLNEGLIFHHLLEPSGGRYREGEEYSVLQHIQNGSYGDVLRVLDNRTGFTCAAKRIPLSHFSSEEVKTWSALSSPRVVELFGAVREGLHVVLFMDLKPACLSQLLKEMTSLPEDLALHYLHQSLEALEHLHHRKVLHLDVKVQQCQVIVHIQNRSGPVLLDQEKTDMKNLEEVDNVLLSADCRDTFLCDFGLSETLEDNGLSANAFRGAAFPGTETHMAPEVVRGDPLSAKVDVWSSCCMLLHMLNGCHPWTRYYSHPLCLQIVDEPPPLWEVPSNCNNFTAKVFRAGLQKDPDRRASAKELRRKTTKALRAVGGLSPWSVRSACEKLYHKNQTEDAPRSLSTGTNPTKPSATMCWVSPWRTTAVDEDSYHWEDGDSDQDSDGEGDSLTREWEPKSLQDDYAADGRDWDTCSDSEVDIYMAEEDQDQQRWLRSDKDYEGDWEEEGDEEEEEEEEEWDSSMSTEYLHALRGIFPLLQKGQQTDENSWGSEPELEYLRDDVAIDTRISTPSPEPRDGPPSCFSCSDSSQLDASEKDSDHSSDDLSSGVFSSCNSQTDGHLEWSASANQPSSHCFEGVDIWIENVQGECLRIRERRQVKVGHVAIGISDQISGKAFTLETLDRKSVSFDQEVRDSYLWLRCVAAPDRCQRWRWRIRDGKLELRE